MAVKAMRDIRSEIYTKISQDEIGLKGSTSSIWIKRASKR
jgi:hypothetical protein